MGYVILENLRYSKGTQMKVRSLIKKIHLLLVVGYSCMEEVPFHGLPRSRSMFIVSTTTLVFIALASTSKEAKWVQNLLFEIPLLPKPISLEALHRDSNSSLVTTYNKVHKGESRHISLRHDIVKRLITKGVITFDYVNTKFNLVDNFTKALPRNSIDYASTRIVLCPSNTNEGIQSNAQLTPGLTIQCG